MKLIGAMLLLVLSVGAFAQHVTCTAEVPTQTCKIATSSMDFWEEFLIYKIPIVIADPASFEREQKSLQMVFNRFHLVRDTVASSRYTQKIMFERRDGKPCPVRVVVSTDSFRPIDEKTFKPIAEAMDPSVVLSDAEYVGAFLLGCESTIDY